MNPRRFFHRLLGFFLAVVLFATNCLFAHAPEANFWKERRRSAQQNKQLAFLNPKFEIRNPKQIQIPQIQNVLNGPTLNLEIVSDFGFRISDLLPYGSIRKNTPPPIPSHKGRGKTIIHIQDVHLNAEAQRNIGRAVQELINSGQVDLIALEGAFEPIDLTPFRAFPHRVTVHKVADYLLKENKISGPIHAALTYNTVIPAKAGIQAVNFLKKKAEKLDPRFRGDDDVIPAIVGIDDLTHYKANVEAYRRSAPLVKKYKKQLQKRERQLSEQKTKVFNSELAMFDEHVQQYRNGKMALGEYVRGLYSLSFKGRGALTQFLHALDLESSLNFDQVEAERSVLLSKLLAKLSKTQTTGLMNHTTAFRTGAIRHSDFYQYLNDLCEKSRVSLTQYQAMKTYLQYILLAESIDGEALFKELRQSETEIYELLAKNGEEKLLIAQSKQLHLVGKLLDFALTKEEWEEYRTSSKEDDLQMGNLSSFESFYTEAEIRDQAMAQNLIKEFQRTKNEERSTKNLSILVTGGFHSKGIEKRLTEAGFTVVSFVPKITKVDTENGSAYLSVFAQEKTPLEKLFEGEKLFLAQFPWSPEKKTETVGGLLGVREVLNGPRARLTPAEISFVRRHFDVPVEVETWDSGDRMAGVRFKARNGAAVNTTRLAESNAVDSISWSYKRSWRSLLRPLFIRDDEWKAPNRKIAGAATEGPTGTYRVGRLLFGHSPTAEWITERLFALIWEAPAYLWAAVSRQARRQWIEEHIGNWIERAADIQAVQAAIVKAYRHLYRTRRAIFASLLFATMIGVGAAISNMAAVGGAVPSMGTVWVTSVAVISLTELIAIGLVAIVFHGVFTWSNPDTPMTRGKRGRDKRPRKPIRPSPEKAPATLGPAADPVTKWASGKLLANLRSIVQAKTTDPSRVIAGSEAWRQEERQPLQAVVDDWHTAHAATNVFDIAYFNLIRRLNEHWLSLKGRVLLHKIHGGANIARLVRELVLSDIKEREIFADGEDRVLVYTIPERAVVGRPSRAVYSFSSREIFLYERFLKMTADDPWSRIPERRFERLFWDRVKRQYKSSKELFPVDRQRTVLEELFHWQDFNRFYKATNTPLFHAGLYELFSDFYMENRVNEQSLLHSICNLAETTEQRYHFVRGFVELSASFRAGEHVDPVVFFAYWASDWLGATRTKEATAYDRLPLALGIRLIADKLQVTAKPLAGGDFNAQTWRQVLLPPEDTVAGWLEGIAQKPAEDIGDAIQSFRQEHFPNDTRPVKVEDPPSQQSAGSGSQRDTLPGSSDSTGALADGRRGGLRPLYRRTQKDRPDSAQGNQRSIRAHGDRRLGLWPSELDQAFDLTWRPGDPAYVGGGPGVPRAGDKSPGPRPDGDAHWKRIINLNRRGHEHLKAGRLRAAESYFRKVLAIARDDTEKWIARNNLAQLYLKLDRYDDGLAVIESNIKSLEEFKQKSARPSWIADVIDRTLSRAVTIKANLLLHLGRTKEAAETLSENGDTLSPWLSDDSVAHNLLALILHVAGRTEDGIRILSSDGGYSLRPHLRGDPSSRGTLLRILSESGQDQLADGVRRNRSRPFLRTRMIINQAIGRNRPNANKPLTEAEILLANKAMEDILNKRFNAARKKLEQLPGNALLDAIPIAEHLRMLPYEDGNGYGVNGAVRPRQSLIQNKGFTGGEDQYWKRYPHQLVKALSGRPGPVVIADVGMAQGRISVWIANQNAEFKVIGTDRDPGLFPAAVDHAKKEGVAVLPLKGGDEHDSRGSITFVAADAASLPFADESLDAVVLHRTRSVFLDPALRRQLDAEIARVVRPGGFISLVDDLYVDPADTYGAYYAARYRLHRAVLNEVMPDVRARLGVSTLVNPNGTQLVLSLRDPDGQKIDDLAYSTPKALARDIELGRVVVRGVGVHEDPSDVVASFAQNGMVVTDRWRVEMDESGPRQGRAVVLSGLLFRKSDVSFNNSTDRVSEAMSLAGSPGSQGDIEPTPGASALWNLIGLRSLFWIGVAEAFLSNIFLRYFVLDNFAQAPPEVWLAVLPWLLWIWLLTSLLVYFVHYAFGIAQKDAPRISEDAWASFGATLKFQLSFVSVLFFLLDFLVDGDGLGTVMGFIVGSLSHGWGNIRKRKPPALLRRFVELRNRAIEQEQYKRADRFEKLIYAAATTWSHRRDGNSGYSPLAHYLGQDEVNLRTTGQFVFRTIVLGGEGYAQFWEQRDMEAMRQEMIDMVRHVLGDNPDLESEYFKLIGELFDEQSLRLSLFRRKAPSDAPQSWTGTWGPDWVAGHLMPFIEEALRFITIRYFGFWGGLIYAGIHAFVHFYVDIYAARGDHLTWREFLSERFWDRLMYSFAFSLPYLLLPISPSYSNEIRLLAFEIARWMHVSNNTWWYTYATEKTGWNWLKMSALDGRANGPQTLASNNVQEILASLDPLYRRVGFGSSTEGVNWIRAFRIESLFNPMGPQFHKGYLYGEDPEKGRFAFVQEHDLVGIRADGRNVQLESDGYYECAPLFITSVDKEGQPWVWLGHVFAKENRYQSEERSVPNQFVHVLRYLNRIGHTSLVVEINIELSASGLPEDLGSSHFYEQKTTQLNEVALAFTSRVEEAVKDDSSPIDLLELTVKARDKNVIGHVDAVKTPVVNGYRWIRSGETGPFYNYGKEPVAPHTIETGIQANISILIGLLLLWAGVELPLSSLVLIAFGWLVFQMVQRVRMLSKKAQLKKQKPQLKHHIRFEQKALTKIDLALRQVPLSLGVGSPIKQHKPEPVQKRRPFDEGRIWRKEKERNVGFDNRIKAIQKFQKAT